MMHPGLSPELARNPDVIRRVLLGSRGNSRAASDALRKLAATALEEAAVAIRQRDDATVRKMLDRAIRRAELVADLER